MPRNDLELLAEYGRNRSETAFGELVTRYVHLVYSVALRRTGNPHHAEEITQAVFIILARKADQLGARVVLSGWLYQTARLTAANFIKSEHRRQQREQEAYMQSLAQDPDSVWEQIAPRLDDAMAGLGEADRNAIVLRYFENKTAAEIGAALRISEAAAHKRVTRALARLRGGFVRRGVTLSAVALAGAISAKAVPAAPLGMAARISAAAGQGAAATQSTTTLVKGVLKIMAWTKTKTIIVVAAGVLLAGGTTTLAVREIQAHKTYPWQVPRADFGTLYDLPPMVKIVPTKFTQDGSWCGDSTRGAMGIAQPVEEIVRVAYSGDKFRTAMAADLPPGKFDFFAKLVPARQPNKSMPVNKQWTIALQKELQRKFGVVASQELRPADVLVLKPASTGVRGFKPSHAMPDGHAMINGPGSVAYFEQPPGTMVNFLERHLRMPIQDQTGLGGNYDYQLKWSDQAGATPALESLQRALHEQLGLELVPTNMAIQMLVIKPGH